MKVFGIGLSKTGTTSLTEALKILGYSATHDTRIHDLYETLDAATDTPIAARYKELDILFPNSKFILTVRDFDSWLTSYENHNKGVPLESLDKYDRFEYSWIRVKLYGSVQFDKELSSQGYIKYHQEVNDYFKDRPQDILILNICGGEGWPQLCAFLDKPIPLVSFPYLNKSK